MKPEQLRNRILAADLAWIPVALSAEQALCSGLRCRQLPLGASNFVVYVVCTVFAWVLLSEKMHLDGFRGGWRLSALVSHLALAAALVAVILLAVETVSERYIGRLTLSVFSLFLWLGFLAIRAIARYSVLRRFRAGKVNRVVIIGSDRLAGELAAKFKRHPELLCEVIGFLCPEAEAPRPVAGGSVLPANVSTMEVIGLLRRHGVNELVIAHAPASNEILNLVALCRQQAIRVSLVPQPYELYLSRLSLLDLGGLPLLRVGDMAAPASARMGKRLLDLGLGFSLAVISLPLILVSGAVLRLRKGRAFRWERRMGWRGAEFPMLRLNVDRSVTDSHPDGGKAIRGEAESRSSFERLLGQFSISELPQFWNVLRGEMSLVGPRPEGVERAHRYSAWQQQRLAAKPGMTGLAQVQGLREEHSSEDKTRHDLQYMLQPSLLNDISLVVETIWTLAWRLTKLGKRPSAHPSTGRAEGFQSVVFSSVGQPFTEMLHAHRTQPGAD